VYGLSPRPSTARSRSRTRRVEQSNFHDYRQMLRMTKCRRSRCNHRAEQGSPGLNRRTSATPRSPAWRTAIFAATGKRIAPSCPCWVRRAPRYSLNPASHHGGGLTEHGMRRRSLAALLRCLRAAAAARAAGRESARAGGSIANDPTPQGALNRSSRVRKMRRGSRCLLELAVGCRQWHSVPMTVRRRKPHERGGPRAPHRSRFGEKIRFSPHGDPLSRSAHRVAPRSSRAPPETAPSA